MASPGSVQAAGGEVSRPAATSRPRLARGCRLSEQEGQEAALLVPEGAMRLNPSGLRILQYCDGLHTFAEIVSELASHFPGTPTGHIEQDTATFLEQLQERRAVDYE